MDDDHLYVVGAPGLDSRLHSIDGKPWCRFMSGTTQCVNGTACLSPNHVEDKDPWSLSVNIKRDRFGRYLLPHPETGVEQSWTRVTTIAKTLDDTYGLNEWAKRNVAFGIGLRDDLRDLAASADGPDDKKVLDDVVKQAEHAAATSKKANRGTALHGITQKADRGDKNIRIPAELKPRVDRYSQAMADHGIQVITEMIERIVVVPEFNVAGQMDRGVFWRTMDPATILDLKTGSIDYAMVAIAIQLTLYANATHWWDGQEMKPMPKMNKDYGLVLHLPSSGDVEATLHKVDLRGGYELLKDALRVRETRKTKGKHLFETITPGTAKTVTQTAEHEATPRGFDRKHESGNTASTASRTRPQGEGVLRDRVMAIVNAGFKEDLLKLWDKNVPTFAEGGLTDENLAQVEQWCVTVEQEHGL